MSGYQTVYFSQRGEINLEIRNSIFGLNFRIDFFKTDLLIVFLSFLFRSLDNEKIYLRRWKLDKEFDLVDSPINLSFEFILGNLSFCVFEDNGFLKQDVSHVYG